MLICYDQRNGIGCGRHHVNEARFCEGCGRPLQFAIQVLDPGTTVGQYQVVRIVGHGAFGAVYEASDTGQPNLIVALKETFDPADSQRFQREFAILSQLRHDNLPRYYAAFEANGKGYLVMEFVPGQSLDQVLRRQRGPLLESQVLGYALQLCNALSYLHRQQPPILHRDIKPANIRLTPDGLLKLVDFGLLKIGSGATNSSRLGLTPAYAPLEQYGGAGHTDGRSDLYSLGASLYHMLSGVEPPPATSRVATSPDPLRHLADVNPGISPVVAATVMQALALSQNERFPDVDSFKQVLLGGTGVASGAMPTLRVPPPMPTPAPVVPSPAPTPAAGLANPAPAAAPQLATTMPAPPVLRPHAVAPAPVAPPAPQANIGMWIAGAALALVLMGGGGYWAWNSSTATFSAAGGIVTPTAGATVTSVVPVSAVAAATVVPTSVVATAAPVAAATAPPPTAAPSATPAPTATPAPSATPAGPPFPSAQLDQLFGAVGGTFGAAVYDPASSTQRYTRNSDQAFPAASLIKVPIVLAVYDLVRQGQLDINEQMTMEAGDVTGGTGSIQRSAVGSQYSLRRLCVLMLGESDNTAGNMILRRIGFDAVNNLMTRLGANQTVVQRRFLDMAARQAGRDNFTSPADMLLLLQELEKGDLTGAAGKDEILAAMQLNEERNKIQAELPGDVPVAHKTGTIDNVEHDAGIVYLPNQRYYVVLMSNNVPNATGIATIGQASGIVYRWFTGR